MRKIAMSIFASAIITLFLFTQAFAQTALPDYTKWSKGASSNTSAVHNGTRVILLAEFYENLDVDNLYLSSAVIIHDEQKRPWIALYIRTTLYKDGNKLVLAGAEYYLFENSNNKWSLAKDFSKSKDLEKDTADFLKSQYDLEFKQ